MLSVSKRLVKNLVKNLISLAPAFTIIVECLKKALNIYVQTTGIFRYKIFSLLAFQFKKIYRTKMHDDLNFMSYYINMNKNMIIE